MEMCRIPRSFSSLVVSLLDRSQAFGKTSALAEMNRIERSTPNSPHDLPRGILWQQASEWLLSKRNELPARERRQVSIPGDS
jgi:hypothetical protein